MAKILLASAYFYRLDAKQWEDARPYPPLGTMQAAAVLRGKHEVRLFDAGLRRSPEELTEVLSTFDPQIVVIYDDGFNYLTKMCLTVMRDAAFTMIQLARQAGCKLAISSSDSTDHYGDYLRQGADAVLMGEAEGTLAELMDRWTNGSEWHDVAGIAWTNGSEVALTTKRPVMRDLDALPLPAWDLVDLQPYRTIWQRSQGYFSLNIATTRGCPFKCNWCAKPIYGNRYNSRSPAHVVREMVMLQERYAPDHLWMCDDIFGLKPGWVQAFREELRTAGVRIPFKVQCRADLLLEGDAIDALVDAGLREVWIGAESGSQKILDAMDKGITVEQIATARRVLGAKGVRVGFFLQFGYLGEDDDDIRKTIAMLDQLQPDDIGISVSYPLPGTFFHKKVEHELGAKTNWRDSDDLAMMFRQRHRPEFYKRLHR